MEIAGVPERGVLTVVEEAARLGAVALPEARSCGEELTSEAMSVRVSCCVIVAGFCGMLPTRTPSELDVTGF